MNILFCLAAAAVLQPAPLPPPGITDPVPEVVLLPDLTIEQQDGEQSLAVVRLENDSPVRVGYTGYGAGAPLYSWQEWNGEAWVAPGPVRGICGTGLGTHWLEPGEILEFAVPSRPGLRVVVTVRLQGAADALDLASPPLET